MLCPVGRECSESITLLPAAFPTMACCGLWNVVTQSHMLIRLTYVACETIKEPGGPRGQRTVLRLGWECWIRGKLLPCKCLWVAAWRARDGAATGTVCLVVYCQMERLPVGIHT